MLRAHIREYVRKCGGDPDDGNILEKTRILEQIESEYDDQMMAFGSSVAKFVRENDDAEECDDEFGAFAAFSQGGDA